MQPHATRHTPPGKLNSFSGQPASRLPPIIWLPPTPTKAAGRRKIKSNGVVRRRCMQNLDPTQRPLGFGGFLLHTPGQRVRTILHDLGLHTYCFPRQYHQGRRSRVVHSDVQHGVIWEIGHTCILFGARGNGGMVLFSFCLHGVFATNTCITRTPSAAHHYLLSGG